MFTNLASTLSTRKSELLNKLDTEYNTFNTNCKDAQELTKQQYIANLNLTPNALCK